MESTALIYSENEFGNIDGKVANGLVRHSEKYKIIGVIDSTKAEKDAGEFLDKQKNGIPIFKNIYEAVEKLKYIPKYFIWGIAPLTSFISWEERKIIFTAMKMGMDIVNGLPEFFSDDDEFIQKARDYSVQIYDIRKPPKRKKLHNFTGRINQINTPVLSVLGTDCAVGKRTTAVKLVEALKQVGLNAVFIATGQTGILQGAKYGVAVDVLSSGFSSGEVENAILNADKEEAPDIIIVEGQGALSHPAFTSSSAILRGAKPDAVIIQHPPKRINHCDYPNIPMPSLESEIELIEMFSNTKVIAITINHEDMAPFEVKKKMTEYEYSFRLPATDVLMYGCDKLVKRIFKVFPKLQKQSQQVCQLQE